MLVVFYVACVQLKTTAYRPSQLLDLAVPLLDQDVDEAFEEVDKAAVRVFKTRGQEPSSSRMRKGSVKSANRAVAEVIRQQLAQRFGEAPEPGVDLMKDE